MTKTRLEAFSDAVIAIIMTIMVLELKVPHDTTWKSLEHLWPVWISYVLSFIMLGIYWGNHHHLIHTIKEVRGGILWANLHLLFWLSLIPFVTSWMGENHFSAWPVALYGLVLLMCGMAWEIQRRVLLRGHEPDSALARALGRNRKEWASLVLYAAAIGLAFINSWLACGLYALVAAIWLIPDRRLEREIKTAAH